MILADDQVLFIDPSKIKSNSQGIDPIMFWKKCQASFLLKKVVVLYDQDIHGDFIKNTGIKEHLTDEINKNLSSIEAEKKKGLIGIFSSGSTGDFKLFIHSVDSLKQSATESFKLIQKLQLENGKKEITKIVSSLPFFHTGGLLNVLRANIFNLEFIHENKISPINCTEKSLIVGVPSQLSYLLKEAKNSFTFYAGGAAINKELIDQSKEKCQLIPTYGLTESCGAILYQDIKNDKTYAFSDVQISLTDEGLLQFDTNRLFKYSWGQVDGLKIREAGNYITKDLAKIDETRGLQIVGRQDNLIICGGENISPIWLLNQINEKFTFSSTEEISIQGIPDFRLGQMPVVFYKSDSKERFKELGTLLEEHFKGLNRPRLLLSFPDYKGIKPSQKDFLQHFEEFHKEGIKI